MRKADDPCISRRGENITLSHHAALSLIAFCASSAGFLVVGGAELVVVIQQFGYAIHERPSTCVHLLRFLLDRVPGRDDSFFEVQVATVPTELSQHAANTPHRSTIMSVSIQ